ncbi:MAG: hypothetical protein ABI778_10855, partial [Ignavibacteriota bacterium]
RVKNSAQNDTKLNKIKTLLNGVILSEANESRNRRDELYANYDGILRSAQNDTKNNTPQMGGINLREKPDAVGFIFCALRPRRVLFV